MTHAPRILHILDHSLPAHSGYTFRTRALMKAQAAQDRLAEMSAEAAEAEGNPAVLAAEIAKTIGGSVIVALGRIADALEAQAG